MKKNIALGLILLLIASCAHHPKTFNASLESEIGDTINKQILQSMEVAHDEPLNDYVRMIGQKISAQAGRQDLDYRFIVLTDDRIYATHVPGGYVYLTTGLLKFLQSEIELAGILSSEVGMLQYRDPRLSEFKKAFDFLIRTGSYIGPAFGPIGGLSVLGLALVGNMTGSEKSLTQRLRQADKLTLDYMMKAGYDPQGFIDPLRRMRDPHSSFRPYLFDYLESHQVTPEHLARLDLLFQKLPLAGRQFDSGRSEFMAATQSLRNDLPRK